MKLYIDQVGNIPIDIGIFNHHAVVGNRAR